MNPVAITLLLAAALAAFCALAWRKLAIVVKLAPEPRWDHPARPHPRRPRQRLPPIADGRARMEAGRDARGDLPRLHDAARAQGAAARGGIRRHVRLPRARRRPLRDLQGLRRDRRAVRGRLCAVEAARAEARAARAQSRGARDPVADRRDHGHRFRFRRLPLRAQGVGGPADRARAVVRVRRRRDRRGSSRDSRRQRCRSATTRRTGSRCSRCSASW